MNESQFFLLLSMAVYMIIMLAIGFWPAARFTIPETISWLTAATAAVLLYTYWGGMWADAVTDVVQMFFILLGLGVSSVAFAAVSIFSSGKEEALKS